MGKEDNIKIDGAGQGSMTEIKLKELFQNGEQEQQIEQFDQQEEQYDQQEEQYDQKKKQNQYQLLEQNYEQKIIKSVNISDKGNDQKNEQKVVDNKVEDKQIKYRQFMIDKKELEI